MIRSDYVNEILKHYPGWEDWEVSEKSKQKGQIYLFGSSDDLPVKIGFSTNIASRLIALKTSANAWKRPDWRYLAVTTGTLSEEKDVHRILLFYRKKVSKNLPGYTEWYQWSEEVKELYGSMLLDPDFNISDWIDKNKEERVSRWFNHPLPNRE